jgi:FkbM family methyltransferase
MLQYPLVRFLIKRWVNLPQFKGRNRLYYELRRFFRPVQHQQLCKVRWGGQFFINLGDEIDAEIYFFRLFDPETTFLAQHLIQPKDTVFDIGANIGYFTVLFGQITGTACKVHAFEPNPLIFKRLEKNTAQNNFAQVKLNQRAVGSSNTTRTLYWTEERRSGDANLFSGKGKSFEVDQIKLDDYCQVEQVIPQIIKIDVEGAEFEVIKGAEQILTTAQPLLILEYNTLLAEKAGYHSQTLLEYLRGKFGYQFYTIGYGALQEFNTSQNGINLLGLIPELSWHKRRMEKLQIAFAKKPKYQWVEEIYPLGRRKR